MISLPPYDYRDIIERKDWEEFVASRLTPEWATIREKEQKARASYVNPHRTSRKLFPHFKKELVSFQSKSNLS